ncbi:hypothetical protein BJP40_06785 [Streptomyces sp. CC53]|nr:hypothetical protein BJP40_06785 [Streptomyces sp. CC53]
MSGIATMIRDGVAKRWFTTHPFHSGARFPLAGWERDLQAPFMIGITADGIGHTGGTLLGVNYEATAADGRRVRMGPTARGAFHSMYELRYGFRPSLLEGAPLPPGGGENVTTYTIKPGDTLYGIGERFEVDWRDIAEANNIDSPYIIHPGRDLEIPGADNRPVVRLSNLTFNARNDDVRVRQEALNAKGYNAGPVDGWYYNMTKAAVQRFQEAQGWTGPDADGMVGLETVARLGLRVEGGSVPTPAPAPPPAPSPKTVNLANLAFNARNDDVKIVQQALKDKGYDPGVVDGWYYNMTRGAVRAFQEAQGWDGDDADGMVGPETARRLGLNPVGTPPVAPAPTPVPSPSGWRAASEPTHDYTRVSWGGKTVNRRTAIMLDRAIAILRAEGGPTFSYLTQGSYNRGVSASAGTHDGGGVVDIPSSSSAVALALRKAGFFAWVRTPAQGFSYHIHAVAIGDRELSSSARGQVTQGFQDRNGLAGRGPDPDPDPYPDWTKRYGTHVSPD